MDYYLGVDQSLTSTGMVILGPASNQAISMSLVGSKVVRGAERLALIAHKIDQLADEYHPDLAVLEGYSIGSINRPFDLGEVGGIIKLSLWRKKVPFFVVAPKSMKKFITGRGDVKKEAITKAIERRWKLDIPQNDIADAYGFARIARALVLGNTETRAELEVLHTIRTAASAFVVPTDAKPPTMLSI